MSNNNLIITLKILKILIKVYVLPKLIPNLKAKTPACMTTIKPSAIKLIV